MATKPADKRTRLVRSAAKLAHEWGFDRATLGNIAEDADVPLGNVYYYFKTKEAIGEALLEQRAAELRAELAALSAGSDPKARLSAYVDKTLDARRVLAKYGCPIGTLCTELRKDESPLASRASKLFDEILGWLEIQFGELGKKAEARELAAHVVSVLQGATLLSHSLGDPRHLEREGARLKRWIRSL